MANYTVIFKSGSASQNTYTVGDKISYIEISDSDESYYQTGRLSCFGISQQSIGDTVQVYINTQLLFNGYLSRIEHSLTGVNNYDYQLVGKTFDLWRYVTGDNASFSGTTCFIASSLINRYCPSVQWGNTNTSGGVSIPDTFDLSNTIVGDGLKSLVNMDGYKFHVDNENRLQYYNPSERENILTVTEEDILDMTPIEKADDDIVNDVLVVGGSGYSTTSLFSTSHPNKAPIISSIRVAQRFNAKGSKLSAVNLYMDKTAYPYTPDSLNLSIWNNTQRTVFVDTFDNWNYLNVIRNSSMALSGSRLCLGSGPDNLTTITVGCQPNEIPGYGILSEYYVRGSWYAPSVNCIARNLRWYGADIGFTVHPNIYGAIYEYHGLGDCGHLVASSMASSLNNGSDMWHNLPLTTYPTLYSGTKYYFVVWNTGAASVRYHYYPEADKGMRSPYTTSFPFVSPLTGEYVSSLKYCIGCEANPIYEYMSSGHIQSYSYPVKTRYMLVEFENPVSSNKIYMSGTNNSGSTWVTLTPGTWYDFGSESSLGTKIKYRFSSNTHFTPSIDVAKLKVSDSSGDVSQVVFNDTFADSSYLSSNTMKSSQVTGGYLQISSNTTTTFTYADSCKSSSTFSDWYNWAASYDHNESTKANTSVGYDTGVSVLVDAIFTTPITYHSGWSMFMHEAGSGYHSPTAARGNYIYVSGANTNGWKLVRDGDWYAYAVGYYPETIGWGPIPGDQTYKYYNNIKGVRYSLTVWCTEGHIGMLLYELGAYKFNKITWSGSVVTNLKTTTLTTNYLKAEMTGYHLDRVIISGSADNGAHWTKLTNNVKCNIGTPGTQILLKYYLKPWIVSGVTYPNTPKIDSCKLTAYSMKGEGAPQSGSKVEYSDDITLTPGLVPYPPSWTGWNLTYTSPKLQLVSGGAYWLVFPNYKPSVTNGQQIYQYLFNSNSEGWTLGNSATWANGAIVLTYGTAPQKGTMKKDYSDLNKYSATTLYFYAQSTSTASSPPSSITWWISSNSTSGWTKFKSFQNLTANSLYQVPIPSKYVRDLTGIMASGYTHAGQGHVAISSLRISGAKSWAYGYNRLSKEDGEIQYSWNGGTTWSSNAQQPTIVPSGNITMKLGWTNDTAKYRLSNQTSINRYGRYFKKVDASDLTNLESLMARAQKELQVDPPYKGQITIDGNIGASPECRFSANLSNFKISTTLDIVSYTHKIDKNGFTTVLDFGKHPYDITKKVSDLEKEVNI